jgi:outer membrane protein TolC
MRARSVALAAAAAVALPLVAAAQPPVAAAQPPGVPLSADELLGSVSRALPLLERARQEVSLAEGTLVEARGAFDLKLKAGAESERGFYDNDQFTSTLEQPLALFGLNAYGGYRNGRGTFAPYEGKSATLSEGEINAGFGLPLLRNRAIDARRADRAIAEVGVGIAERELDKARLSFYKDALAEYWDWVAAGQQRRIAQALLDIAVARDQQLADAATLGQVAPVERTDNRRAILQRQSALATAERQVELQAIDVSLYLRGADGRPVRPGFERLPELPRPDRTAGEPDEAREIEAALERRPELKALRLTREQQAVALRVAENGVLPALDLYSEVARDLGTGLDSRAGANFQGGIVFELPFQRRKATGKALQLRAKLSVVDQELRWAEDRVRADVQDALSALRATRAILGVVAEELAVARELESLERDRFALGDSTQFLVNLRELATADAALREARALADYQKALVTVEAATGRLLDRVP